MWVGGWGTAAPVRFPDCHRRGKSFTHPHACLLATRNGEKLYLTPLMRESAKRPMVGLHAHARRPSSRAPEPAVFGRILGPVGLVIPP
jgi:hypothetical protein